MTHEVVALEAAQSLPLAREVMQRGRLRHLPVIDSQRHLVGLITHRHLLAAQTLALARLDGGEADELPLEIPVASVMTREVEAITPEAPATEAAQRLIDHKAGALPVVDAEGRLCGIVTEADFLRVARAALEQGPRIEVDDIMSTDLVTLELEQSLALADQLMALQRIRHLPVVESRRSAGRGPRLVGLVTHRDLLNAQHRVLCAGLGRPAPAEIADIVQRDVWSVTSGTSARDAAATLADHRFGCLPVVADGELVGIVTASDFLALVVRMLARHGHLTRRDPPVSYYMSTPVCSIAPDEELEIARYMMQARGVSCVAVVDHFGELVGVLSRTDLLEAGHPSDAPGTPLLALPAGLARSRMTPHPVTIDADQPVSAAARRLLAHGVHRLFVCERRRPIGVISTADVMLAVRDARIQTPLGEVMTPLIFSLGIDEPADEAAQFLRGAQVRSLVVTEGGWPVGLLSQRELLAARMAPGSAAERIMSQAIVVLPPQLPLFRAAGQAAATGAQAVVVNGEDGVFGIITPTDFTRACAGLEPGARAHRLGGQASSARR